MLGGIVLSSYARLQDKIVYFISGGIHSYNAKCEIISMKEMEIRKELKVRPEYDFH